MKWITRQKIRVNRTATCWLINRFIDREAEFLFVPSDEVAAMQAAEDATGFDAPGATYPHKFFSCTSGPTMTHRSLRAGFVLHSTK